MQLQILSDRNCNSSMLARLKPVGETTNNPSVNCRPLLLARISLPPSFHQYPILNRSCVKDSHTSQADSNAEMKLHASSFGSSASGSQPAGLCLPPNMRMKKLMSSPSSFMTETRDVMRAPTGRELPSPPDSQGVSASDSCCSGASTTTGASPVIHANQLLSSSASSMGLCKSSSLNSNAENLMKQLQCEHEHRQERLAHHEDMIDPREPPNTPLVAQRYMKECIIGSGTYGDVYKAKDVVTKTVVALKKMRFQKKESNEGALAASSREIAILKFINHPNVVRLLDVVRHPSYTYLVFEYMDLDLRAYLDACYPLPLMHVKHLLLQLLAGTAYLHSQRILHRDLKPQNILISQTSGSLKICDFGLGRQFFSPAFLHTQDIVTLWYRPPEVLQQMQVYETPIDLWTIGCIFGEMLTGSPLFPGESEIDMIHRICSTLSVELKIGSDGYVVPEAAEDFQMSRLFPELPPDGIDLIQRLLEVDPSKRIGAVEAIRHPFFKDLALDAYNC